MSNNETEQIKDQTTAVNVEDKKEEVVSEKKEETQENKVNATGNNLDEKENKEDNKELVKALPEFNEENKEICKCNHIIDNYIMLINIKY